MLGHILAMCLTLEKLLNSCKVVVPLYLPTSNGWGFRSLHVFIDTFTGQASLLGIVSLSNSSLSGGWIVVSHCRVFLHFPFTCAAGFFNPVPVTIKRLLYGSHGCSLLGHLFIELIVFLKLSPVRIRQPTPSPCMSYSYHNCQSSLSDCFLQEELYSRYLQVTV